VLAEDQVLENACRAVRMVVMDVDGVLTDGAIALVPTYGPDGPAVAEAKVFDVKDGLAIHWAARMGIATAFLTSRASPAVVRRAEELSVTHLITGARAKAPAFLELCRSTATPPEHVAYLGDDLPDLGPMGLAGLPIAPADAAPEVRAAARWVTAARGGHGAAREAIEGILRAQGLWGRVVEGFLAKESGDWTA
jgi:3-deoxy-D-manno-octulosonate 8-phosphate phosphatase (KDO 8-P phosphatase)